MIGAPTGADPLSQDVSTKSLERTRTDSKPKPRALKKHDPILRDIAAKLDAANDVEVSHLPWIGGFINSAINGILDVTS